jgi:uncharacterized membrane protein
VLAAAVVVVPWLLANPGGVGAVYDQWRSSSAGYGSPWLIPGIWGPSAGIHSHHLPGFLLHSLSPAAVTRFAILGWVLALIAGAVLALGAPRRPRVAQVALVVVGIALLTGKAYPVQDALWLLPLVALALPRWRDHLAWFVAEAAYFVAVWLYAASISTPTRGLPGRGYVWLLILRLVLVAWLVVATFRTAWRSELDPVRNPDPDAVSSAVPDDDRATPAEERPYVDDPLGGPLDGAPDRLIVRLT